MHHNKNRTLKTNTLFLFCCVFLLSGCITIPLGDNIPLTIKIDTKGNLTFSTVDVVDNSETEKYISFEPILPDNFEIGYSPVGIPIRIAIDSTGKVLISAEASLVTPFGVFDLSASKNIIEQTQTRLLIIQIDDAVNLFELKEEDFQIDFYNNGDFYRIISFKQDSKGNIELVLQSIR